MTDNQYIFFIGGKDLEMETIKQLLSAHNQPYICLLYTSPSPRD